MLNIEQILDTMTHNVIFDKADFLKYVKYMESNVKTIPIEEKPYYRELYMSIKGIRSRL